MKKKAIILIAVFILMCIFISIRMYCSAENKLWEGICSGNLELVKEAVKEGCDIDKFHIFGHSQRCSYGVIVRSPLIISLYENKAQIAEFLIESGANLDKCVDIQNHYIIHYASKYYDTSVLKKVLESGADMNRRDIYGRTPLNYAIWESEEHFKLLIENGAVLTSNDFKDAYEDVETEKLGIIKCMIEKHVDTEIDYVVRAAFLGDNETVIENFKECKELDILKRVVAAFGNVEALKTVTSESDDYIQLLDASVRYNNYSSVKYLLETYDYDIGETEPVIRNSIVECNSLEMMTLLSKYEFPFSSRVYIMRSLSKNKLNVLEYLLRNGHNPDKIEQERIYGTPLLWSIAYKNIDGVKMLLSYGADPNYTVRIVPFVEAVNNGDMEIIKILVEAGADFNAIGTHIGSDHIKSPLQTAILNGDFECVSYLLNIGADKNYRTDKDETMLDIAKSTKAKRIIELLK